MMELFTVNQIGAKLGGHTSPRPLSNNAPEAALTVTQTPDLGLCSSPQELSAGLVACSLEIWSVASRMTSMRWPHFLSLQPRTAPLSRSCSCFVKYVITSYEYELEKRAGGIGLGFVL